MRGPLVAAKTATGRKRKKEVASGSPPRLACPLDNHWHSKGMYTVVSDLQPQFADLTRSTAVNGAIPIGVATDTNGGQGVSEVP